MCEWLPEDSPARWHATGDRPYSMTLDMLWRTLWATWQLQVILSRLGGQKDARMPADEMPRFPWEKGKSANRQTFGAVAEDRKEEALDYLLSLEM